MPTISQFQARLKSVNIPDEATYAIGESRGVITREQKNQLLRGLRADGTKIGRYRSKVYAAKKAAMNPLPGFGFMDWKLTGELQNEIFIDVRPGSFVIDSADGKTGSLISRFGDPFGLTLESRIIAIKEKIKPVFLSNIRKKLFL